MSTDRIRESDSLDSAHRAPERAGVANPTTEELDAIAWNLPRAADSGPGGEAAEPESSVHSD